MNARFAINPIADLVATTLLPPDRQTAAVANLGIADRSDTQRHGCKGPGAATWLTALGLPIPARPNQWLPLDEDGRVVRLGTSEFLIEGPIAQLTTVATTPRGPGVYPVLHQDAAFVLTGAHLNELLRQTCSLNFRSLAWMERPMVLTSMAGVNVIALQEPHVPHPVLRIWCDGTFGHYLWNTLLDIALSYGGGAVAATRID